jgi:hypothetical protein
MTIKASNSSAQPAETQELQYGKNKKKIVFYLTDHEHARMMAKMQYDGIKQAQFFRAVMDAYVQDEDNIRAFVESTDGFKISENTKKQHKRERKKIALQNARFNLSQTDIDEIFDILEDEND